MFEANETTKTIKTIKTIKLYRSYTETCEEDIVNVMNGNRTVPQVMANEMYNISRRRIKNSEKEMA